MWFSKRLLTDLLKGYTVFVMIYKLQNYIPLDYHFLLWKWFNITFWIESKRKNEFSYTTWENFISGASQGYIWRFILFIIIVCDLSLEHEDCCKNAADVIDILLTSITQKLFTWLANNQIKANHNKCHLLLITKEEQTFRFPIWQ